MRVAHSCNVLIGDYLFQRQLKEEVLTLLKTSNPIPKENTNVKAFHTDWNWEPDNLRIKNLKSFILAEIERHFQTGSMNDATRGPLKMGNFWANVYYKGDYAESHHHNPYTFSFAYFLKCENYHSPLIFSESGKKVPPKEGRYVIFPAYLKHHVPKQQYDDTRITLSGNSYVQLAA